MAFDFLTGNYERLANSLQGESGVWRAKKDRKKQGITLAACRKNDCVVENALFTADGKLVLVDNNSALSYDRNMMDALPWMLEDTCFFPARFVEVGRPARTLRVARLTLGFCAGAAPSRWAGNARSTLPFAGAARARVPAAQLHARQRVCSALSGVDAAPEAMH